jgi:hypothetical protein
MIPYYPNCTCSLCNPFRLPALVRALDSDELGRVAFPAPCHADKEPQALRWRAAPELGVWGPGVFDVVSLRNLAL